MVVKASNEVHHKFPFSQLTITGSHESFQVRSKNVTKRNSVKIEKWNSKVSLLVGAEVSKKADVFSVHIRKYLRWKLFTFRILLIIIIFSLMRIIWHRKSQEWPKAWRLPMKPLCADQKTYPIICLPFMTSFSFQQLSLRSPRIIRFHSSWQCDTLDKTEDFPSNYFPSLEPEFRENSNPMNLRWKLQLLLLLRTIVGVEMASSAGDPSLHSSLILWAFISLSSIMKA